MEDDNIWLMWSSSSSWLYRRTRPDASPTEQDELGRCRLLRPRWECSGVDEEGRTKQTQVFEWFSCSLLLRVQLQTSSQCTALRYPGLKEVDISRSTPTIHLRLIRVQMRISVQRRGKKRRQSRIPCVVM